MLYRILTHFFNIIINSLEIGYSNIEWGVIILYTSLYNKAELILILIGRRKGIEWSFLYQKNGIYYSIFVKNIKDKYILILW